METENSVTCTHTSPAKIALYIGIVLAFFLGGMAVYPFVEHSMTKNIREGDVSAVTSKRTYEEGFAAARKLVEESSVGNFFRMQINKSTITGTVTDIQDNRINIHDGSVQNDSLYTLFNIPNITDRTIIVDANTKVVRITENTSLKSQTGVNGYQKVQQIKPDGSISVASSTGAYTETPSSTSAINMGDVLMIVAGESTGATTELVAQKIVIAPSVK